MQSSPPRSNRSCCTSVRQRRAAGGGDLRIDDQRKAAGGLVDREGGYVAARGGWRAERLSAGIGGRGRAGDRIAVRRIMVQYEEEVSRRVAKQPEGVDALGKEGLLGGKDAVAAHRELRDIRVLARIGGGASGPAR